MKKFFAFVIAMAVAVVANAAPYTMVAPATVDLGGTFSVVIMDAGNAAPAVMNLSIVGDKTGDFPGTWSKGEATPAGGRDFGFYGYDNAYDENTVEMPFTAPVVGWDPVAGVAGSVDVTAIGALGDVIDLILYNESFEAVQTASVEIVPEPMTMSLLGLGGLVAARRRRA